MRKRLVVLLVSLFVSSFILATFSVTCAQSTVQKKVVSIEIRYNAPEASVVNFVWGINGWQPVPEELRAEGTIIQNDIMFTSMRRDNETFIAVVRVPAGSSIQYGFGIKETADGRGVDVWDTGIDPLVGKLRTQPILIATYDKTFSVDAAVNLSPTFITQTFHYRNIDAGDAVMVWGINGWKTVSEATKADDTIIEDDLMHTQMFRDGDDFQTSIQVPQGSTIEYGFLFTKPDDIVNTERIWDGDYAAFAADDGFVEYVDPQGVSTETVTDSNVTNAVSFIQSLLSKHWSLLLIGICMAFGILIGFRNT